MWSSGLMTDNPPELMLVSGAANSGNIVGWFISTKLDGIRVTTHGQNIITRGGIILPIKHGVRLRPGVRLDGELTMNNLFRSPGNRHSNDDVMRELSRGNYGALRVVWFDIMLQAPFRDRLRLLQSIHCLQSGHTRIGNLPHLNEILAGLMAAGHEGAVLRSPYAVYASGRSNKNCFKVKF